MWSESMFPDSFSYRRKEPSSGLEGAIAETRNALKLPSQLRSIDEAERSHFPELAQAVIEDPFMDAAPRELDPEKGDIEAVFKEMWTAARYLRRQR